MVYNEVKGNLFDAPTATLLAHCISADFALGAGIAKDFASMDVKRQLIAMGGRNKWEGKGYCVITGSNRDGKEAWNVANLVTKQYAYGKPTYETLRQSLEHLRWFCNEFHYIHLAMPAIGCGLDRLEWNKVSEIIKDVFKDTSVNITVYLR